MPIQLKGTTGKTSVEFSVIIRKILHVDEVGKSMTVQFESRRRWFDRQLTFQNLKLSEDLNVDPALSEQSGSTWFPWVDFYNIENRNKVSVLLTIPVFSSSVLCRTMRSLCFTRRSSLSTRKAGNPAGTNGQL